MFGVRNKLKRNLKACDIPAKSLESLAQDRPLWHTTSRGAAAAFETLRTDHLRQARDSRKASSVSTVYSAELADACVVQELGCSPTTGVIGRRTDTNGIRRSRRGHSSRIKLLRTKLVLWLQLLGLGDGLGKADVRDGSFRAV